MTNKLEEIAENLEKLAALEVRSQDLRAIMVTLVPQLSTNKDTQTINTEDFKTLQSITMAGRYLVGISKKSQRLDPKLALMLDTLGKALQGL